MKVATLLAMPSAAGLFVRAITQSGAAANTLTAEQGLAVGSLLAAVLEVPVTRDAIAAVPQDRLSCTASEVVTEVQLGTATDKWGSLDLRGLPFAPVVDGTVLPVHPLDSARAGAGVPVPLLTGWNRDENRLGLVAMNMLDAIDESTLLAGAAGYGLGPEGVAIYRAARPGATPGDLLAAIGTDWSYALPALRYIEARIAGDAGPTWVYRFDHLEPADNRGFGSCHATEVPFVFRTENHDSVRAFIGDHPSPTTAVTAHKAWVSFARKGTLEWEPYDTTRRTTALIGEKIRVVDDPAPDERHAWDGIL